MVPRFASRPRRGLPVSQGREEAEALLRNAEAALNVGKERGDRITFHASE